MKTLLL